MELSKLELLAEQIAPLGSRFPKPERVYGSGRSVPVESIQAKVARLEQVVAALEDFRLDVPKVPKEVADGVRKELGDYEVPEYGDDPFDAAYGRASLKWIADNFKVDADGLGAAVRSVSDYVAEGRALVLEVGAFIPSFDSKEEDALSRKAWDLSEDFTKRRFELAASLAASLVHAYSPFFLQGKRASFDFPDEVIEKVAADLQERSGLKVYNPPREVREAVSSIKDYLEFSEGFKAGKWLQRAVQIVERDLERREGKMSLRTGEFTEGAHGVRVAIAEPERRLLSSLPHLYFEFDYWNNNWDVWKFVRGHPLVQELVGKSRLEQYNSYLVSRLWDFSRFEHWLGENDWKKAAVLDELTPEFVPYVVQLAWRGRDAPLFVKDANGRVPAAARLQSLAEQDLEGIVRMGVPGLANVVDVMRNNPESFYRRGTDAWVSARDSMLELVGHYLAQGNEDDRLFAVKTAVHLLRHGKLGEGAYESLVDKVRSAIRLNEVELAGLLSRPGLFRKWFEYAAQAHSFEELRNSARKLSEIIRGFNSIAEKADAPEFLEREFEKGCVNLFRSNSRDMSLARQRVSPIFGYLEAVSKREVLAGLGSIFREDVKRYLMDARLSAFSDYEGFEKKGWFYDMAKVRDLGLLSEVYSSGVQLVGNRSDFEREARWVANRILKEFKDGKGSAIYLRAVAGSGALAKLCKLDSMTKEAVFDTIYDLKDYDEPDYVDALASAALAALPDNAELPDAAELHDKMRIVRWELDYYRRTFWNGQGKLSEQEWEQKRAEYAELQACLVSYVTARPVDALRLLEALAVHGYHPGREIWGKGRIGWEGLLEKVDFLKQRGLRPTDYLMKQLLATDDAEALVDGWKSVRKSFSKGKFDPASVLHRCLEYAHFREIVESEHVRHHLKQGVGFSTFEKILLGKEDKTIDEKILPVEVEAVAYEASLLMDYILKVKQRADELGMGVIVVPNLSYGYLPVSALTPALEDAGIQLLVGSKIGSSESHDNPNAFGNKVFKGKRAEIAGRQPVIIVVDGTKHLVGDSRYPDAYQGYLNEAVAINDALGHKDVDYSGFGKTPSELEKLRMQSRFREAVNVYEKHASSDAKPYGFFFWNTSGSTMSIRRGRKPFREVSPFDPLEMRGPALIFCNVGVRHEQLPEGLRSRFASHTHQPAYFDDNDAILRLSFKHDEYGIAFTNELENAVANSYAALRGREPAETLPALVRYTQKPAAAVAVCT